MIGQCLICGLAHDLGKIQRFEALSQVAHLSDKAKFTKMQKEKPHQLISEAFLKDIAILEINMDLNYAETIAWAVLKHHNPPDEKDKLLEVLIEADIKTRNEEKEYCCAKIKEKLALKEENKSLDISSNITQSKQEKAQTLSADKLPEKEENKNPNEIVCENLIPIEDFSKRDINKNYGLGELNGYLVAMATNPNEKTQAIISNFYEKEQEKNLAELELFIEGSALLMFYKSSSLARAENTLRKLLLDDELKNISAGYIPLKNEVSLQEAVEKVTEAMQYSQKNNLSLTNYTNIASVNQAVIKVITDEDLENDFLSGSIFENISQEITQIERKHELNKEMPFEADIDSIKSMIIKNIAKTDSNGNFFALPYKRRNRILVETEFLKTIISTLTNCNKEEAQKKMNYLVNVFGNPNSNPRLIYEVSTRKGYYNALYNIIMQNGKTIKYPCILFCAKALNISSAELSMYCNQETLNGVRVELFANKE